MDQRARDVTSVTGTANLSRSNASAYGVAEVSPGAGTTLALYVSNPQESVLSPAD
jgi:hypothetical protein